MNEKKYNIQELLLLMYVLYGTIICTIPSISNIIGSYSVLVNFAVGAVLFAINVKKYDSKLLFLIGIMMVNSIVGALMNNTGFGSLTTIINLYIMFLYADKVNIKKNFILISAIIIFIGNILFLFVNESSYNTNSIGYLGFIMTVFAFILYENIERKTVAIKIMIFLVVIVNIIRLYFSESRASLMGLITFFVIMIFPFIITNKKIFKSISLVIILGAILFPYIYVGMWQNNVQIDLGTGNKKFYSGRQIIWSRMMDEFKGKELYGIGSNFRTKSTNTSLNVHNSLFAIYMIYGTLNFIVFLPLFIRFIWKMQEKAKIKTNRIAIAGIIGMLVISYYETNLIWSDVYMFFVVLCCIAYNKKATLQGQDDNIKFINTTRSEFYNGSNKENIIM